MLDLKINLDNRTLLFLFEMLRESNTEHKNTQLSYTQPLKMYFSVRCVYVCEMKPEVGILLQMKTTIVNNL